MPPDFDRPLARICICRTLLGIDDTGISKLIADGVLEESPAKQT